MSDEDIPSFPFKIVVQLQGVNSADYTKDTLTLNFADALFGEYERKRPAFTTGTPKGITPTSPPSFVMGTTADGPLDTDELRRTIEGLWPTLKDADGKPFPAYSRVIIQRGRPE